MPYKKIKYSWYCHNRQKTLKRPQKTGPVGADIQTDGQGDWIGFSKKQSTKLAFYQETSQETFFL